MIRRRAVLVAPALLLAAPARAAEWPGDRPIEVFVPFPPGGGVDVMARVATQRVAAHLPGARFVITNRVGAAGQIGFEAAFLAAPDGYTLGCITTPALNTIALEHPTRYRIPDFTYLANLVDDPGGFFVEQSSALHTLEDLAAAARAAPDALAVGTAGVGSDDHLLLLGFEVASGTRLAHVPYNGTGPVVTDLLGGRLAVGSFNMGEGVGLLRDGKVRALAQAGPRRWAGASGVPTFTEAGFAVTGGSARGIVGPPGLPDAIRARLVTAFGAALMDPAFQSEATRLNLPLRPVLGDAYRAMVLGNDAQARALWARRPWRE